MKVLFVSGALLLAALAVGCGGGREMVSLPATSGAATSEPTTSSPGATSSRISPAAPCGAADIFPAVRRRIGPQVVRVEVVRCQHDYARANALPDASACPPTCNETYEVYVRWIGTRWQVVDFGTGM